MLPTDRPDRLSALVSRFTLEVTPVPRAEANLTICGAAEDLRPDQVIFAPAGRLPVQHHSANETLFSARAEWGGTANPLVRALPAKMIVCIANDPEMQSLSGLLVEESRAQRCGSSSVINRLGEVLMVRLLRNQLAEGTTNVGILGGLADSRLSHAIVAMHEEPGRHWRIDQLAELAGLSVSRFADRFTQSVGFTPMAYLRHWRMILARQDLEQGDRVQSVALRYGYASAEALSRAFKRTYGDSPTGLRAKEISA